MARVRFTSWARMFALTALAVAILASAAPAYAAPGSSITSQLASKQKLVDDLNAKLDDLSNQSEIASEEYNRAAEEMTKTAQQVAAAQTDLANTRGALAIQNEILEKRVASIYRDNNLAAFEILLDSKSVADFVGRVKFINTIGLNDANATANLKAQKNLMEQQLALLQAAQARQQELTFELKARQVEIDLRAKEQQALLDATQQDIRDLLDQQAAASRRQQTALLKSLTTGTNKSGIVVTPGSPVETALAYIGVPYVWGGATPSGFDCSGLVLYVFNQHGVILPHYSGYQFLQGEKIPLSQIQPNDVVFFGSPVHHVGIYIGGGYFIHAPRTGDVVKISRLADRSDIAGVRRYPWISRTNAILNAQTSTNGALNTVR